MEESGVRYQEAHDDDDRLVAEATDTPGQLEDDTDAVVVASSSPTPTRSSSNPATSNQRKPRRATIKDIENRRTSKHHSIPRVVRCRSLIVDRSRSSFMFCS